MNLSEARRIEDLRVCASLALASAARLTQMADNLQAGRPLVDGAGAT